MVMTIFHTLSNARENHPWH